MNRFRVIACRFGLVTSLATLGCSSEVVSAATSSGSGATGTTGGGEGSTGAGGLSGAPIDEPAREACKEMFHDYLERLIACGGGPPAEVGLVTQRGDTDRVAVMRLAPSDVEHECARIGEAVAAGRTIYDPVQLETCKQGILGLSCNDMFSVVRSVFLLNNLFPMRPFFGPSCLATFVGTVDSLGACGHTVECARDNRCIMDETYPGSCGPTFEFKDLLESCGPPLECTSKEYCDPSTMKCVPRKSSGSCETDNDCAGGYTCQGDHGCAPYIMVGAPCIVGDNQCVPGAFCHVGKCTPWPAVGGACGEIEGEQVGCAESKCSAAAHSGVYTSTGTCLPRLPSGSPCSVELPHVDFVNPCMAGTQCRNDVCGPGSEL